MPANKYLSKRRSGIHGWGMYAKMDIPQGTRIIEYVGEKISKVESERRGPLLLAYAKKHKQKGAVYIFELNKKYDIDGHVDYNLAKYINHSCDPNCEVDIIRGRIWIMALRDIRQGEEIFYNYGYDDFDDFHEHPCLCKSTRCPGYIMAEDEWGKLREALKKSAKSPAKLL